jgi:hypothetical protein
MCINVEYNFPFSLNFLQEGRAQMLVNFNDFSEAHLAWLLHEICEVLLHARYRLYNFRWAYYYKKIEAFDQKLHFSLAHTLVQVI